MKHVHAWFGPAILAAICSVFAVMSVRPIELREPIQLDSVVNPCNDAEALFQPVAMIPDPLYWQGESGVLRGPALVERTVCASGVLELQLTGRRVNGWAPHAVVTLDEEVLDEREVTQALRYRVRVPHPGLLRVAYLNDLYLRATRGVQVQQLHLSEEARCDDHSQWNADVRTGIADWAGTKGNLYGQVTLTTRTCASGTLYLNLLGFHSDAERPRIALRLDGELLGTFDVTARNAIKQDVPRAGTVTVELTNGYFEEVGDRNLTVNALAFRPTSR